MIAYHRHHVKVAELYYDEPVAPMGADIARLYFRSAPRDTAFCEQFHTLLIDLRREPEALLAGMNSTTRQEVRKGAADPVEHRFVESPDDALLDQFFAFYDAFAAGKHLAPANRTRITAMRDAGVLDLSVMEHEGAAIVWHCHFRAEGHARLLHSASLFRDGDKAFQNLVSRANRRCHYLDMLRYRELGLRFYDFGGWYAGEANESLIKVNRFKEAFGGERRQFFNIDEALTMKGHIALRAQRAMAQWKERD